MFKKLIPHATVALFALVTPALAKDLNSIGATFGTMGNPFFVQMAKGAEAKEA